MSAPDPLTAAIEAAQQVRENAIDAADIAWWDAGAATSRAYAEAMASGRVTYDKAHKIADTADLLAERAYEDACAAADAAYWDAVNVARELYGGVAL